MQGITLDQAPLRTSLLLREAGGGGLGRRLAALGLRRGAELTLLQTTAGGGRLALIGGSRIALGAGMLTQITADVLE